MTSTTKILSILTVAAALFAPARATAAPPVIGYNPGNNVVGDAYAKQQISKAVRALTGWTRVRVKLTSRVTMQNRPATGSWAQHSVGYVVEPLDRGESKATAKMFIGSMDLTKKGSGMFAGVDRHGVDRLYRFTYPTYPNGHSYQPLSQVVRRIEAMRSK